MSTQTNQLVALAGPAGGACYDRPEKRIFRRGTSVAAVTVQVRRRGTITLPREVRRRYGLDEGDVFTLIDLEDGTLVLSPKASRVAQLADQAADRIAEAGVGLDDLLRALDEERGAYYRDNYAAP